MLSLKQQKAHFDDFAKEAEKMGYMPTIDFSHYVQKEHYFARTGDIIHIITELPMINKHFINATLHKIRNNPIRFCEHSMKLKGLEKLPEHPLQGSSINLVYLHPEDPYLISYGELSITLSEDDFESCIAINPKTYLCKHIAILSMNHNKTCL